MTEAAGQSSNQFTEEPQIGQSEPHLKAVDPDAFRPLQISGVETIGIGPASRSSVEALNEALDNIPPASESTYIPQSSDIPQEHSGIPTKAKVIAGLTLTAAAIGGAATMQQSGVFDGKKDEANVSLIPHPEQPTFIPRTEIPNPLKTPEVTAVPTQKTGFSEKDGAFTFRTEKGEVLNVPQIEGLTAKRVKVGEVEEIHYFANEGNKYGIEINGYAGEYTPNVDIYEDGKRKELGGVSLKAQVAKKLLDESIASIPTQSDKWKVVLPVDSRQAQPGKEILLSFESAKTVSAIIAKLSFNGDFPTTDIIPGLKNIKSSKGPNYNLAFLDNIRNITPYGEKIYPGKEMSYITVAGDFIGANDQEVRQSSFGDLLGTARDKVYIWHTAGSEWNNMSRDKILSVGDNIPVFLQSSNTGK